jgi:hypothetical protein
VFIARPPGIRYGKAPGRCDEWLMGVTIQFSATILEDFVIVFKVPKHSEIFRNRFARTAFLMNQWRIKGSPQIIASLGDHVSASNRDVMLLNAMRLIHPLSHRESFRPVIKLIDRILRSLSRLSQL